jgi:hypothetical protein
MSSAFSASKNRTRHIAPIRFQKIVLVDDM